MRRRFASILLVMALSLGMALTGCGGKEKVKEEKKACK